MRLLDRTPDLPFSEGQLYVHNSGGEHATKFSGIENLYNPLRRSELAPLAKPGVEIEDISGSDLQDMLFSDKYEVIIDHQIDVPNNPGARLAGVAIGERKRKKGEFAMRMTVKELVVHPELRERHIASYMLGRLTQNIEPTEMVVATNKFTPEDWFIQGLESAGFRHKTRNGSPAVWLPGKEAHGRGNIQSPNFVKNAEKHMPKNWYGYWEFAPDDDLQLRAYREHRLIGIVRPIKDTSRFDEEIRDRVADFTVVDAGDAALDTLNGVTEKEALIALLNNYELLDNAA